MNKYFMPQSTLPDNIQEQLIDEIVKICGADCIVGPAEPYPSKHAVIVKYESHHEFIAKLAEGAKEMGEYLKAQNAKMFDLELYFVLTPDCNNWANESLLKVKYASRT